MKTFLIYESDEILNAIVAEDIDVAKEATSMNAMEYDDNLKIWIGWKLYENGEWRPPRPYNSWYWDEETKTWICPVPYPEDGNRYDWDEESGSWVLHEEKLF